MVCKRCGQNLTSTGFICSNCGAFMTKEQVEIQKQQKEENLKRVSLDFVSQKYVPDKVIFEKREEKKHKNTFWFSFLFFLFFFLIILLVYLF